VIESRAARDRARVAAAMVEGWLNELQGAALFDAAASCTGRGAIVEIGSWKGRSTVWLASGARLAGQHVFAVDPHVDSREDPAARTLGEFEANLQRAGVTDVVRPVVMTSEQAARAIDGPVEVLFVDGDHSDAGSEADAGLWLPRLVDGGTVLMHDVANASYTGPRRVFRRRICWNPGFDNIHRVGSMGIARRVKQRSLPQGAWGVLAGLLLYLLDAKAALKRIRTS
jgi:predicted O-methyltransferase YrrM